MTLVRSLRLRHHYRWTAPRQATPCLDQYGNDLLPAGYLYDGQPVLGKWRGGDETQHQDPDQWIYLGSAAQAQYQTVMNGNSAGLNADPSQFKGSNRPVEKASWEDAQIFLARLNSIEQTPGRLPNGWKYVLPTEGLVGVCLPGRHDHGILVGQ